MKLQTLLFALLSSIISTSAFASGDSTWLLCENGAIAASVVIYQSPSGHQVSDLNLIAGVFTSNGKLIDTNESQIVLNNANGEPGFEGAVTIDYMKKTVSLKGDLLIPGTIIKINQVLPCKVLDANKLQ